ncbi:MAG: hypothetical protein IAC69_02235 [Proteobacteria bacterium]|uniref:Uncharacterized protein n=1 Tax=Candidatus Enterousia avistercoris TaxID=2840788 RepID=A0A9D9DHC1_9PROT|nr:hypothetical protein [Candidatus Enterousia avistercoris]
MMYKKSNVVVGLTTVNTEMLQISVPALGRLRQKFTLVIYNDNPMVALSRRQIRKLGYCGDLQIINGTENIGTARARMAVVDAAIDAGIRPEWIIFCDDDDMLVDLSVPDVSNDNFAVIQNAIVIRHRICDLLRAMDNATDMDADGENIELARPNVGFAGTLMRWHVVRAMFDEMRKIIDAIQKIDDGLEWRAPVDAMMWSFMNIFAKHENPNAVPIYMDKINYVKNKIDTPRIKYGKLAMPLRNPEEHWRRVISRYNAVMNATLDAAALRGDD